MIPSPLLAALPGDEAGLVRAAAMARLAEEGGDASEALRALVDLASRNPADPDLSGRILDQALIAGDLRLSVDAAARLWQTGQQRFDARMILLVDAVRRNDWRTARSFADPASAKAGLDLTARLVSPAALGWIDVATRETAPERNLLRFGRTGDDPTAQWIGATMLLVGGKAEAAASRAADLYPSNRTSQMVAARLAATFSRRGDAVAAALIETKLAKAREGGRNGFAGIKPAPVADARQGLAQWFGLLADGFARSPEGNRELALLFARSAAWIDAADPYGQLALAEALAETGQQQAAIALLARGAAGRENGNGFALRQAELLAESGDHASAVAAALPRGAELPGDIGWLVRFADVARAGGDDALTLRVLDQLIVKSTSASLDPDQTAGALLAKGELLMRSDRWDQARPLLEEALAARPDDPATLNFVGYSALERRDNVPLALARIEAAWRKDAGNAAITDSLGWAYFLTGDVDRAVPLLEVAARGEPSNAVINEHLGDALWKSGRYIEARYAWRVAALSAEPAMATRLAAKLVDGLTPETIAP